jgi:hypothetical protein
MQTEIEDWIKDATPCDLNLGAQRERLKKNDVRLGEDINITIWG